MTALLPPNLLRLFAPRPPVPYLRPLVRDDSDRGPDRLTGIGGIVRRLRDEAEEKEYKDGMEGRPTAAEGEAKEDGVEAKEDGVDGEEKAGGGEKMEVDGEGEENADKGEKSAEKGQKKKLRKKDAVAAAGVIGQEAVKMRREARVKRQAAYKKDSEASCESGSVGWLR